MCEKVNETWRKLGISEPMFYTWSSQFSGMTVSQPSQLRQLRDEKVGKQQTHTKQLVSTPRSDKELVLAYQLVVEGQRFGAEASHIWGMVCRQRPHAGVFLKRKLGRHAWARQDARR